MVLIPLRFLAVAIGCCLHRIHCRSTSVAPGVLVTTSPESSRVADGVALPAPPSEPPELDDVQLSKLHQLLLSTRGGLLPPNGKQQDLDELRSLLCPALGLAESYTEEQEKHQGTATSTPAVAAGRAAAATPAWTTTPPSVDSSTSPPGAEGEGPNLVQAETLEPTDRIESIIHRLLQQGYRPYLDAEVRSRLQTSMRVAVLRTCGGRLSWEKVSSARFLKYLADNIVRSYVEQLGKYKYSWPETSCVLGEDGGFQKWLVDDILENRSSWVGSAVAKGVAEKNMLSVPLGAGYGSWDTGHTPAPSGVFLGNTPDGAGVWPGAFEVTRIALLAAPSDEQGSVPLRALVKEYLLLAMGELLRGPVGTPEAATGLSSSPVPAAGPGAAPSAGLAPASTQAERETAHWGEIIRLSIRDEYLINYVAKELRNWARLEDAGSSTNKNKEEHCCIGSTFESLVHKHLPEGHLIKTRRERLSHWAERLFPEAQDDESSKDFFSKMRQWSTRGQLSQHNAVLPAQDAATSGLAPPPALSAPVLTNTGAAAAAEPTSVSTTVLRALGPGLREFIRTYDEGVVQKSWSIRDAMSARAEEILANDGQLIRVFKKSGKEAGQEVFQYAVKGAYAPTVPSTTWQETASISALTLLYRMPYLAVTPHKKLDVSHNSFEAFEKAQDHILLKTLQTAGPLLLKVLQMIPGAGDDEEISLRQFLTEVPAMDPGWVLVQLRRDSGFTEILASGDTPSELGYYLGGFGAGLDPSALGYSLLETDFYLQGKKKLEKSAPNKSESPSAPQQSDSKGGAKNDQFRLFAAVFDTTEGDIRKDPLAEWKSSQRTKLVAPAERIQRIHDGVTTQISLVIPKNFKGATKTSSSSVEPCLFQLPLNTKIAGSIAQAHFLTLEVGAAQNAGCPLNFTGKDVNFVLKVLRPNLEDSLKIEREHIQRTLSQKAEFRRAIPFLETAARRIGEEIDFAHELGMLQAGVVAYQGKTRRIRCVEGVAAGATWLLMTRAPGDSVADIADREGTALGELKNMAAKHSELYTTWLSVALSRTHPFFHADPHMGNMHFSPRTRFFPSQTAAGSKHGGDITLLDFGNSVAGTLVVVDFMQFLVHVHNRDVAGLLKLFPADVVREGEQHSEDECLREDMEEALLTGRAEKHGRGKKESADLGTLMRESVKLLERLEVDANRLNNVMTVFLYNARRQVPEPLAAFVRAVALLERDTGILKERIAEREAAADGGGEAGGSDGAEREAASGGEAALSLQQRLMLAARQNDSAFSGMVESKSEGVSEEAVSDQLEPSQPEPEPSTRASSSPSHEWQTPPAPRQALWEEIPPPTDANTGGRVDSEPAGAAVVLPEPSGRTFLGWAHHLGAPSLSTSIAVQTKQYFQRFENAKQGLSLLATNDDAQKRLKKDASDKFSSIVKGLETNFSSLSRSVMGPRTFSLTSSRSFGKSPGSEYNSAQLSTAAATVHKLLRSKEDGFVAQCLFDVHDLHDDPTSTDASFFVDVGGGGAAALVEYFFTRVQENHAGYLHPEFFVRSLGRVDADLWHDRLLALFDGGGGEQINNPSRTSCNHDSAVPESWLHDVLGLLPPLYALPPKGSPLGKEEDREMRAAALSQTLTGVVMNGANFGVELRRKALATLRDLDSPGELLREALLQKVTAGHHDAHAACACLVDLATSSSVSFFTTFLQDQILDARKKKSSSVLGFLGALKSLLVRFESAVLPPQLVERLADVLAINPNTEKIFLHDALLLEEVKNDFLPALAAAKRPQIFSQIVAKSLKNACAQIRKAALSVLGEGAVVKHSWDERTVDGVAALLTTEKEVGAWDRVLGVLGVRIEVAGDAYCVKAVARQLNAMEDKDRVLKVVKLLADVAKTGDSARQKRPWDTLATTALVRRLVEDGGTTAIQETASEGLRGLINGFNKCSSQERNEEHEQHTCSTIQRNVGQTVMHYLNSDSSSERERSLQFLKLDEVAGALSWTEADLRTVMRSREGYGELLWT